MITKTRLLLSTSALVLATAMGGCAAPADSVVVHTESSDGAPSRSESSGPAPAADYPAYADPADVADHADVVVVAEYVDDRREVLFPEASDGGNAQTNPQHGLSETERARAREEGAVPVNVSRVRVTEVLKGEVKPGQTLDVAQLAAEVDGKLVPESSTTLLKDLRSGEFLLMLAAYEDAPFDLLNPTQALFEVVEDGALIPLSEETAFQGSTLPQLRAKIRA